MTNFKKSNSEQDIEIIQQFYSGLNQNDVEAVMELFSPSIFRIEFEAAPLRGLTEMRQNIVSGRSTWAEGSCTPTQFSSQGNKYVVDAHVKVRLKNESKWIDGRVADGFLIQDGKITEFHSYMTKQKAFEWAGISKA